MLQSRVGRIAQESDALCRRKNFAQQLEPLGCERIDGADDPSRASARTSKGRDQPGCYGVGARREHDRDRLRRLPCSHRRDLRWRIDKVWLMRDQLGGQFGQVLVTIVGVGAVVGNGLPFDPAESAHFLEEGFECDLLFRQALGARTPTRRMLAAGACCARRWQRTGRDADANGELENAAPVHWIISLTTKVSHATPNRRNWTQRSSDCLWPIAARHTFARANRIYHRTYSITSSARRSTV